MEEDMGVTVNKSGHYYLPPQVDVIPVNLIVGLSLKHFGYCPLLAVHLYGHIFDKGFLLRVEKQ